MNISLLIICILLGLEDVTFISSMNINGNVDNANAQGQSREEKSVPDAVYTNGLPWYSSDIFTENYRNKIAASNVAKNQGKLEVNRGQTKPDTCRQSDSSQYEQKDIDSRDIHEKEEEDASQYKQKDIDSRDIHEKEETDTFKSAGNFSAPCHKQLTKDNHMIIGSSNKILTCDDNNKMKLSTIKPDNVNDNGKSTAIALVGDPINRATLNSLFTAFRMISKGYELNSKYGFLLPKFISLVQSSGLSVYNIISTLPYIALALQRANAPTVTDKDSSKMPAAVLGKLNLASAIEDPEKLKTLLNNEKLGDLAIDSLKVVAGVEATELMDKLMKEVDKSANDSNGGVIGINGEHLNSLLQHSDSLKQLFKTDELTNEGLKYIHAYMDSYLHPEIAKFKNDVLAEMQQIRTNRQNDLKEQMSIYISFKNKFHGTLLDAVTAFRIGGQRKINEKLRIFNANADKVVSNWKNENIKNMNDSSQYEQKDIDSRDIHEKEEEDASQYKQKDIDSRDIHEKEETDTFKSEDNHMIIGSSNNILTNYDNNKMKLSTIKPDNDVNYSSPSNIISRSKSMILQTTPDEVLKKLASAYIITKKYDYLLPYLTAYFLPKGIAISALKFICLVTYITLVVQRENLIPDSIAKKEVKFEKMGLSTDRIVDFLSNKEMMAKIFQTDHSRVAVDMLKFVAGPQTTVIDSLVTELRTIKIQKYGEQSQEKLKLIDLLMNVELFKKLYSIKQYAESTIKQYLPETDFTQIKNEIGEEMNKFNNEKGPSENVAKSTYNQTMSETIHNAVSATSTVALRKSNELIGSIGSGIKKEADDMTKEYTSPESKNAKGLAESTIKLAPSKMSHIIATALVAKNRFISLFQRRKATQLEINKDKASKIVEETVTGNNDEKP